MKKEQYVPRVDTMGEKLGLVHKITEDVQKSFNDAEKRIRLDWLYNLYYGFAYRWNKTLDKLKLK